MTNEEVNKEIAEYMGLECREIDSIVWCKDNPMYSSDLYIESLDALVPVWKKLKRVKKVSFSLDKEELIPFRLRMIGNRNKNKGKGKINEDVTFVEYGFSIQEAAAHATAKAIVGLSSNRGTDEQREMKEKAT